MMQEFVVGLMAGIGVGVVVAMWWKEIGGTTERVVRGTGKGEREEKTERVVNGGKCEPLNEEEVRRVQLALKASPETARCVSWLTGDVEEEAVRASAHAKPNDGGYAFALAKTAGMVCACRAIEDMWAAVLDGSMADGMKQEREEREKGERGSRRTGGEGRGKK